MPLGPHDSGPRLLGETFHLFLARDLNLWPAAFGRGRIYNVERVPFDVLGAHRCVNGVIDDGKTVAAVLRAKVC